MPYGPIGGDNRLRTVAIIRLKLSRESTRLLAEFYSIDQRVKKYFDSKVKQLKTAPEPEDRATAAFSVTRHGSFERRYAHASGRRPRMMRRHFFFAAPPLFPFADLAPWESKRYPR